MSIAAFDAPDTAPDAIAFVLRNLKRSWGFDVAFSDTLTAPYGADRKTGTIWLPNGLPWREAHARIDRAWLYMHGGSRWVHEFAPGPLPVTLDPIAKVIPLVHRPW